MILASGSPRRRELLARIGVDVTVAPTDIDECVLEGEDPVSYVLRLAMDKAGAAPALPADLVIAADTTVDVDGRILGKPQDEADAREMLKMLSGRAHRVHTGLAIRHAGRTVADVATTLVKMVPITDELMEWYIGTSESIDKAGAYAIQGEAAVLIDGVQGSITNVIGLPMALLDRLLASVGLSIADLERSPISSNE